MMSNKYIIGENNSGKTRKMLETAKKNNLTVVCKNPSAMRIKAKSYGIDNLRIVTYDDVNSYDNNSIAIDEIGEFFKYYFDVKLESFTITSE